MPANDYCTTTDVTNVLSNLDLSGQAANGVLFTTILTAIITYASRALDKFTKRKPGAYYVNADETRYPTYGKRGYSPLGRYDNRLGGGYGVEGLKLWVGELAAAPTSVSVSLTGSLTTYTLYNPTDYICGPYDAPLDGRPYEWLELDIINGVNPYWSTFPKGNKVVGKFGYAASVPDDVKMAAIIQTARWFERAKVAFQDKINIVNDVSALGYLDKLDDDLERFVSHYKRQTI